MMEIADCLIELADKELLSAACLKTPHPCAPKKLNRLMSVLYLLLNDHQCGVRSLLVRAVGVLLNYGRDVLLRKIDVLSEEIDRPQQGLDGAYGNTVPCACFIRELFAIVQNANCIVQPAESKVDFAQEEERPGISLSELPSPVERVLGCLHVVTAKENTTARNMNLLVLDAGTARQVDYLFRELDLILCQRNLDEMR
jgi:hypothetical protein